MAEDRRSSLSGQTAPELCAGNSKHLHCETKKSKKRKDKKQSLTLLTSSSGFPLFSALINTRKLNDGKRRERKKIQADAAVVLWQPESLNSRLGSLAGSEEQQPA